MQLIAGDVCVSCNFKDVGSPEVPFQILLHRTFNGGIMGGAHVLDCGVERERVPRQFAQQRRKFGVDLSGLDFGYQFQRWTPVDYTLLDCTKLQSAGQIREAASRARALRGRLSLYSFSHWLDPLM